MEWRCRSQCRHCASVRPSPPIYVRCNEKILVAFLASGKYFPVRECLRVFGIEQVLVTGNGRVVTVEEKTLLEDVIEHTGQPGSELEPIDIYQRAPAATERTPAAASVFFLRGGEEEEPVGMSVSADKPLPLQAIAEQFGVLESTLEIAEVDVSLSVRELWRLEPGVGSKQNPFQVWGCLGPFAPGFQAVFMDTRKGLSLGPLQVVEQLHISARTAVYGVVKEGDDEMVLKQKLRSIRCDVEEDAYRDLAVLRKTETCPSLPEFICYGYLLASGSTDMPGWGDFGSLLYKPLGSCVAGKVFTHQQVLKAAYDLLLALYHLYLVDRTHRKVTTENIVYVQKQEQFVLIDLGMAHEKTAPWEPGDVPCGVGLARSLAEMAGWDSRDGVRPAARKLGEVSPVLERFANHAPDFPLVNARGPYDYWLDRFASAAGLPPPVF